MRSRRKAVQYQLNIKNENGNARLGNHPFSRNQAEILDQLKSIVFKVFYTIEPEIGLINKLRVSEKLFQNRSKFKFEFRAK